MSEQRITDYSLAKECERLAKDIFEEIMAEAASDEDAEHHCETMMDRAHETADGHQWVIYYHYAHQIAGGCQCDYGEQFLEGTGMPEDVTYDKLATIIAYGEISGRIAFELNQLIQEWEPRGMTEASAGRVGRLYEEWIGHNPVANGEQHPLDALQTLREYRDERNANLSA